MGKLKTPGSCRRPASAHLQQKKLRIQQKNILHSQSHKFQATVNPFTIEI